MISEGRDLSKRPCTVHVNNVKHLLGFERLWRLLDHHDMDGTTCVGSMSRGHQPSTSPSVSGAAALTTALTTSSTARLSRGGRPGASAGTSCGASENRRFAERFAEDDVASGS